MLMVLLVAVCQSPGAGSPGSRLFPQASDAGRVGEKGQGRGMARRVRGWPEVTQQWDKRAQYDVWAEDEVAAGPEQRTSQPSTFGRQGLSALVSLSTCVPPLLPSLTQKSPDTPGSPEGNTEVPGTTSFKPLLPS